MTEDNVMEFCQWLVSEKGIEAGNLSDYINNNEEEVLKLAEEFKKPKFKVGGKVEAAAEMFKCGGKTKKTKKTKKAQNGAVLKSFKSLPYGRSSADLAVLPNDLNKNKADSLITVPADFGGEYTLIKDGITGKIRGNHQSEMSGIKQMDTKKAYQMFRKFADMFNRPIEKHEDGNKINRIGITSGIVKAQGGEKVYNTGEIRADDRTKLGRWWDKVKTNYRNSNWANSGVAQVLSDFTPYGLVHLGDKEDGYDTINAAMSVPLGGVVLKSGKHVKTMKELADHISTLEASISRAKIGDRQAIRNAIKEAKDAFPILSKQRNQVNVTGIKSNIPRGRSTSEDARRFFLGRENASDIELLEALRQRRHPLDEASLRNVYQKENFGYNNSLVRELEILRKYHKK